MPWPQSRIDAKAQVAETLGTFVGIVECNVFGIALPHCDGRAGMAALRISAPLDWTALFVHVQALPSYARPLFIRILGNGMVSHMCTLTYKTSL